jgi:hypothetical protein
MRELIQQLREKDIFKPASKAEVKKRLGNLSKMHVVMQWTKEIDFGEVRAHNPEEAVEIANNELANRTDLVEEEISNKMIVTDMAGKELYTEETS